MPGFLPAGFGSETHCCSRSPLDCFTGPLAQAGQHPGMSIMPASTRSASGPSEISTSLNFSAVWYETHETQRRQSASWSLSAQQLVALAAAELLANGDFDLVRTCESDDCVLHFYDRTKSHRRRWCSMATCGNRAKVQTFRARQRG
jgi:CGNR zinc finger